MKITYSISGSSDMAKTCAGVIFQRPIVVLYRKLDR